MTMNRFAQWVLGGLLALALPQVAAAADKALPDAAQKSKDSKPATPAAEAVVYTCPMHPEVTSDKPGRCPKCGMKLERKAPPTSEKK